MSVSLCLAVLVFDDGRKPLVVDVGLWRDREFFTVRAHAFSDTALAKKLNPDATLRIVRYDISADALQAALQEGA